MMLVIKNLIKSGFKINNNIIVKLIKQFIQGTNKIFTCISQNSESLYQ